MSDNFSLRETGAEVQVEWRIERLLSLMEEPDVLHSPAFSLSDAQWFLEVGVKGARDDDSDGWINLLLYKRYSTPKKHAIKFTLGIRRRDGSVYKSFDEEYEFQEYDCEGMVHFICFSELRQSENVLTTDECLTVFATVRLAEPTVLDEVIDTPREFPFGATHTEEVSSGWKVEDFTSLPKDNKFSLKSPTFAMAGSTWCMEVFPNGIDDDEPGWVSLYLNREGSASEAQRFAYTLGIRKQDGTPQRLFHHEGKFDTDPTEHGSDYFIKSSVLLDPKNGLVSEGSVTFFCTARAHYSSPLITAAVTEGGAPTSSDASQEENASRTTPSEQGKTTGSSVNSLLKQLKYLVVSGHHGDVTFNVKDQVFPAHRSILAVRSPVFSAMFDNDTESRTGIVTVTDFQPDIIKDMLSFIYTGDEGVVSSRNAVELYKAADKYDVQDLKDAALRCMTQELSPGNFFDVIVLASVYDESRLLKVASDFFVENVKLISPTPEWLTFMREHSTLANELLQLLINRKM